MAQSFNPHIRSLIGWFFLMAVVVGAPVLALTGAGYLCTALGLGDSVRLIIAAAILVAGLLTNCFGMKLAGKIQISVVLSTLVVLIATIVGSITAVTKEKFTPFMPNGVGSVGYATTVLSADKERNSIRWIRCPSDYRTEQSLLHRYRI